MKFSNPRLVADFTDWPIGGGNHGQCIFKVEEAKRGIRVSRTTKNKHGQWCKPKYSTYQGKAAIVDGDDGRTYILQHIPTYGRVAIMQHDFMDGLDRGAYKDSDPARFDELMGLINSAR